MRPIDADALENKMYHEAFENDASYNERNPMARWDSGLWIRYKMFENAIADAPTIEPKRGEWIPCNEKMPSKDELVLVSGEYIDYPCVISKGEDVHYWYSKGIVGIAWMPLPKPYKADRKTENSSEKPNNSND